MLRLYLNKRCYNYASYVNRKFHRTFNNNNVKQEDENKEQELLKLKHKDDASNVTWMGVGVNGFMGIGKLLAGLHVNSASLIADAAHSVSDLVSDAVTLTTLKFSKRPPDATHPFGYGRYEALGALAVSSILIGTAGYTAMYSVDVLAPFWLGEDMYLDPKYDDVYIGSHALAMSVAFGSILSKELLYRKTMDIAKTVNSKVLEANAWHHRSDALSSVVVFGSLFGKTNLKIEASPNKTWEGFFGGLFCSVLFNHIATIFFISVFIFKLCFQKIWSSIFFINFTIFIINCNAFFYLFFFILHTFIFKR